MGFDPTNPYSTPKPTYEQRPAAVGGGTLQNQFVSFDQLFSNTWSVYTAQLGMCIVLVLMSFAIGFALNMAMGVIGAVIDLADEPVVSIAFQIVNQVVGLLVQTWIQLGTIAVVLRMIRRGDARIGEFFNIGSYYPRGLGLTFLIYLINVGIGVICLAPAGLLAFGTREPELALVAGLIALPIFLVIATVIMLRYFLGMYLIYDRNMGIMEAFLASPEYMRGNYLTLFLALLVSGFLGGLVALITCGVGLLFVMPYMFVLGAVFYVMATGQSIHDPKAVKFRY